MRLFVVIGILIGILLFEANANALEDDSEIINDFFNESGSLQYIQAEQDTIETQNLCITFGKRVADQLKIQMVCEVKPKQENISLVSWPYDYNELRYVDIPQLPSTKHCYLYFEYINDTTWSGAANLLRESSETNNSLLYGITHKLSGVKLLKSDENFLQSELLDKHEYPLKLIAHIAMPVQDSFQHYKEDVYVPVELLPLEDFCYCFGDMNFFEMHLSYSLIFAKSNTSKLLGFVFETDAYLERYIEDNQLDCELVDSDGRSLRMWVKEQESIPNEIHMWLYQRIDSHNVAIYKDAWLKRNGHYYQAVR